MNQLEKAVHHVLGNVLMPAKSIRSNGNWRIFDWPQHKSVTYGLSWNPNECSLNITDTKKSTSYIIIISLDNETNYPGFLERRVREYLSEILQKPLVIKSTIKRRI